MNAAVNDINQSGQIRVGCRLVQGLLILVAGDCSEALDVRAARGGTAVFAGVADLVGAAFVTLLAGAAWRAWRTP